jgi:hypothetical protein
MKQTFHAAAMARVVFCSDLRELPPGRHSARSITRRSETFVSSPNENRAATFGREASYSEKN